MPASRRRRLLPAAAAVALLAALLAAWGPTGVGAAPVAPSPAPVAPGTTTTAGGAATPTTLPGLPPAPAVLAPAWAVYDATDGTLLAGRGAELPRPIASLTKLMTAMLVIERTTGAEQVPVSMAAQLAGDGSEIDMKRGQKYPVDVLLQAMLAYSANDAAVALAEYVGGTQASFIARMNARAKELRLADSTFTTVNGLDAPTLTQSSPADLVAMAERDMRDPRFRAAVSALRVVVKRPGSTPVTLPNRNVLVGQVPGVDGIKTGFTNAAGYCLISHWKDPKPGATGELYVVVLGEGHRADSFADSRALIEWGSHLRSALLVTDGGAPIAEVPVAGSDRLQRVYLEDNVQPQLRVGARLEEQIRLPAQLQAPLRSGDVVGRYTLLADGKPVASSNLYVAHDVHALTRLEQARQYLHGWRRAARDGWGYAHHEGRRIMEYWGLA